MFNRIKHLIIKELIQSLREKKKRMMIIGPPIIQLILFGYVVTTDVNHISSAVYDLDRSSQSREVIRMLESSGYFQFKYKVQSPAELRDLIDRGRVLFALQIDNNFSRDIKRGMPAEIQIIVDGADSNTAMIAMSYALKILNKHSMQQGSKKIKVNLKTIDVRTRFWYNPDLKSKNYNVPGVIASIIMITCLMLTSMSVVREKEIGTIEQLMVSPIKPFELMLGKTIPFAIIGLANMALVTVIALIWFEVPMRGNLLILLTGTIAYLISILGVGLLISTLVNTQQQAMMAAMFFNMPAMLLSGFMFPIENMPEFFQYLTYLNPLRYFLIIIRSVFLKGSGIDLMMGQIAALLIIGLVILIVSSMRFRKSIT